MAQIMDCHTHTEYSACAEDVSLARYSEFAAEHPLVFAITDHSAQLLYPPDNRWGFWGEDADRIWEECCEEGFQRVREYLVEVRRAQRGNMLVGIELDVRHTGEIAFPEDELGGLDIRLGAVHRLRSADEGAPEREVIAEYQRQTVWLLEAGVEVIAHPFRLLMSKGVEPDRDLIAWLVSTADEFGAALEINSHKKFWEQHVALARVAVEAGVPLAAGTDCHAWHEFGDFSYHLQVAEAAGAPGPEVYLAAPLRTTRA
jgi:histidinol phosphatase-like PHP family hydrolase